jgi:hypothetical protein
MVALVVLCLILLWSHPDSLSRGTLGAVIGFALVWLAVTWLNPGISARRQFRNIPSAQHPIRMEASDSGLNIHSAHSDSKVAWSAYVDWGEGKSVFIVLPQPRIYVPIPKRAFGDAQLAEFREILRRNIASK